MASKPTSIALTAQDEVVLIRVRRILLKRYGKVSATFVFREALRALDEKLAQGASA